MSKAGVGVGSANRWPRSPGTERPNLSSCSSQTSYQKLGTPIIGLGWAVRNAGFGIEVTIVGRGLQHPSGRVIALGRLLLATSYLVVILIDFSQPAHAPAATYGLISFYVAVACVLVVTTWKNWWLDARLAGPAHAFDILVFTALVVLTQGYTSPYFTFFMFLLLSAAIRWGWRETALTAILVTLLGLTSGIANVTDNNPIELQRSVIRTVHLVILSLILMWFGINQWSRRLPGWDDQQLADPSLDLSPIDSALEAAMLTVNASRGRFIWNEDGEASILARHDHPAIPSKTIQVDAPPILATTPFLYDLRKSRALRRDEERSLHFVDPTDVIKLAKATHLALSEGMAIPVSAGSGTGIIFLEGIPNLSVDDLDLGEQISLRVAAHFQRHALLVAAQESAESRSRLAIARDLHDSVVQFLAGAGFRLEAMTRSLSAGRDIGSDLGELKQLMLQEQHELRSFITALRGASEVSSADMAKDIKGLATRLARHWGISLEVSAQHRNVMIPARLYLDLQQIVREAVANAVRHADTKAMSIELSAERSQLRVGLINDGKPYPKRDDYIELPQSLRERVIAAGGDLDISRGMGVTLLSVTLPIGAKR